MKNVRPVLSLLALVLVLSFLPRALYAGSSDVPGRYDPVADPHAIVTVGSARFTILTPQLIRMEWAADKKFEDHASLVFLNRKLPLPAFAHETTRDGSTTIRTSALTLIYTPGNSRGKFTADDLSIFYNLGEKKVVWKPGMPDTGNLLGTTRTLDRVRGSDVQLEPGLISRDGWTVVDDSTSPLFDSADFSFPEGEASPWPWVMLRPPGDRQDWYFFGYGHDYRHALYDFTRVAGKIPLPPRFAFGVWWSRYWSYTDREIEELIHDFHTHETPLDVLVIDMDWHPTFNEVAGNEKLDASGHRLGWTGYSWNKLLFPDPNQFLASVHEQGLKATVNLHPAGGVQPWEDAYPQMARSVGIDPATKQYVPFDIANRNFAANYMKYMIHPLEKQGINFFWLDWQQEDTTTVRGLNPTWWLNYIFFSDQQREGKRALLFHRWGGLGNHRYQIGFSGDTISVWDSLAFQPYFTATAANVGYAYWSHDIGGHIPGVIDPELYLRWIQWGIFSPVLRTHTTKNPGAERRIWAYPEPYSDLMRECFMRRYAMQPYIYTEARKTYDTGLAFLHPLYYDWPDAPEAYAARNEYMFGDSMLADPITQPVSKDSQLATTSVWLPPGDWIEWDSGAEFHGPVTVRRSFSLGQIPLYVKAGGIIPMQPSKSYTDKSADPLMLTVFPLKNGQESGYRLYEDAGDTPGYQYGEAAWTPIHAALNDDGTTLKITVSPTEGHYRGMRTDRAYEIRLPGSWPPSSMTVNGAALSYSRNEGVPGWRFDGDTLTTVILTRSFHINDTVTITVRIGEEMARNRSLLDDFGGKMARLQEAYDILNANWPVAWSPDDLVAAMQTGDRITHHPENAFDELSGLQSKLGAIPGVIKAMRATENSPAFAAASANSSDSNHRLAEYNSTLDTAVAHIADISETQPRAAIPGTPSEQNAMRGP
ncbi:MAG TPA: TIM-barrel domain-containing protein [Candidatus Sulfotelmatobacter sp.]|nr:TIM-barrel domain-containing protein [Candidatus Sulfotelmatobacter sp.]